MHVSKKDFFTIPNILTYVRFLLVPAFVLLYLNAETVLEHILAVAVVLLAALTDIIDGIIARKTGAITDLGKILDPIADKAMQFAMLFCVVLKYRWVLVLLVIYAFKEVVSLCFSGYLFVHKKNIGGAQWYGKVCTVVLYIVMLVFIVLPDVSKPLESTLVGFAAAFMLLAFVMYMSAYIKMIIELKKNPEGDDTPSGDDSSDKD